MKLCYHCMTQIENEKAHTCPNCGKSLKVQQQDTRYLAPGTVLQGKFIVGEPIGSGGFGNTYIGWNSLLRLKVAIKEFYPVQYSERSEDGVTVTVSKEGMEERFQNGLRQFLEEARNVAALQNIRGVVAISNFFEANGTGYIVMEYLEGMDVKTILEKSGNKKDYEWCRRVILTVLHTLRDIHKRGVLHRDIAPDNIFVTNEGIIKLIDFGAAKQVDTESEAEIMLKVGYAPIEQYSRTAPQGPYTDLYAVAALFYRMLTGQKPFPANERLKDDALITPSEMGISLPQQAELAIMVCLNVDARYRLQSADEFMEALDGKFFVPVYEPEWILPQVKERGLPVAAKAAICFGCICLIAGGVAAAVHFTGQSTSEVTSESNTGMQDYTGGMSYDEAVRELNSLGYTKIAEPVYDFSDEPEGTILKQNIEVSQEIGLDDEIIFTVSGGDTNYTMPDFSGKSEDEIIQYFTDRRFDVTVYENPCMEEEVVFYDHSDKSKKARTRRIKIYRQFSEEPAGICLSQSQEAGALCQQDTDAEFSVSVGGLKKSFNVKMPDLTGLTEEEVRKVLKKANLYEILDVRFQEETSYTVNAPAGMVTKQSIEAGKKINTFADKGKKLTVSIKKSK